MSRFYRKVLSLISALSLFSMAACACPKAVAPAPVKTVVVESESKEAVACKEVSAKLDRAAKEAQLDALNSDVILEIEQVVDHCRLLAAPYDNMGVLLLSVAIKQDGKLISNEGILVKFIFVESEWQPVSISSYYVITPSEEKEEGDGGVGL